MEVHTKLISSPANGGYRCHPRLPTRRTRGWVRYRGPVRVHAEDDSVSSRRAFDEGAAQVKRLVNRDRSSFAGEDFEELLQQEFGEKEENPRQKQEEEEEEAGNGASLASGGPSSTGPVKPAAGFNLRTSPFAAQDPLADNPLSPFGSSGVSSPFGGGETKEEKPVEEEPWWSFVKRITLTQVVLFCSFSLIISVMLGTFAIVFNSGAVHFNE